ncbi:beta strand repeat-containing protein, partial [Lacinutrix salivirga]
MKISTRFSNTNLFVFFKVFLFILFASFAVNTVSAQQTLDFRNPTIVNGGANLAVGTQYRFQNVTTTPDGTVVDALVTISSAQAATLNQFDDLADHLGNGLSSFDPIVQINGGSIVNGSADGAYVEFLFEFVLNSNNSLPIIIELDAYSMDVDGNNGNIREYVVITDFGGYVLNNPSQLNYSPSGRFEAATDVVNPGIDANSQFLAKTEYTSISTFTYRAGVLRDSGSSTTPRQFALAFEPITFTNPNAVTIIDAINDDYTSSPLAEGVGGVVGNVISNDIENGAPANAANINITLDDDDGSGATLDASGNLNVPVGTPAGSYLITYTICTNTTPQNCDTATASFLVASDSDGDGVVDITDLDDDNDGILDVDEGCGPSGGNGDLNILSNFGEQNLSNSDDGTEPTSIAGLDVTYDFDNSGGTTITSEDQTGGNGQGEIFKFNGGTGDTGSIDFVFSEIISGSFFKLTDFDQREILTVNVYDENNNLIDLSSGNYVSSLGTQITQAGNVFTEIDSNNNVDGDNTPDDGLGSLILDFSGQLISRINVSIEHQEGSSIRFTQITGFCEALDTDGDGIPNSKDTDSDNDGCPDALEGGNNILAANVLPNGQLDGTANASTNGVPNNVSSTTGQPVGTSANNSQFDSFGQCDSDGDGIIDANDNCNGFDDTVDTDGDTIPDGCDLDNDNDGIIDANEGICTSPVQSGAWTIVSGTEATYDYGNGVIARLVTNSTGAQANTAGVFNSGGTGYWSESLEGDASLEREYSWNSTLTVSFENAAGDPINVTNPKLHLDRVGGSNGAVENSALVTLQGGLTWTKLAGTTDFQVTPTTVTDSGAGNANIATGYTFDSTDGIADGTAAGSLQVNGNLSTFTVQFIQNGPNGIGTDGIEIILFACPDLDTDNDGTPDYLDNDSDNDGCFDALEGGDAINLASVDANGELTGTPDPVTGVPSNVDANNGQTVGGSIDGTPSDANGQCDSDNDGVIDANDQCPGFDDSANADGDAYPDGCDDDDDNDGISDVDEGLVTTNATPVCGAQAILNFNNAFTEESGDGNIATFLLNETFRFPNVAPGIDALVTITELNGTTVPVLDDNGSNVNSFQPQSAFSLANIGDRAYTEFRFDFVSTGGTVGVNDVVIPDFYVNFNDVDGNAVYGEQNWSESADSYVTNTPTELLITEESNFIVGTAGNNEYPGVTNNFPQVNYSTQHSGKSNYTIRLGVVARQAGASASGRQHNVQFDCPTNFVNPVTTTTIDSDGDGIPNHLDLDSDDDGCFDALEGNGGITLAQIDANGVITGAINTNGIPTAANSGNGQADVSSTNPALSGAECTPIAIDDDISGVALTTDAVIDPFADNGNGVDSDPNGNLEPDTVSLVASSVTGGTCDITDANGDCLQVTVLNEGVWTVDPASGEITFNPDPLFFGNPQPIDYNVEDNDGNQSNDATITVIYANNLPVAEDDTISGIDEDSTDNVIDVLADNGNGADDFGGDGPDVGAITLPSATTTEGGTVTVDNGGTPTDPTDDTILYTPAADFNGTDTFDYTITDLNGDTSTATVTVVVAPIVDVEDDTTTTDEDTPVVVDVYDNDNDIPTEGTIAITTPPTNGTVV